ncbi:MAG: glycine betaine/L-proline ABC transporter ATP-binding protein [Acidimicrobiaceae bacterium]|nr:glycine betaine/L-proline ABC transporter ATP-binding protein [Acidimicrobiaceae bacterium]MCY3644332.1 glycine betaine/L-proline ABC transporter ATP-binding protein [Acidimicrobiaceae bacterium]MDE0494749.1 glycine betaine/L-proline ABC transporter ATP-binding protein [Acidimicrobiaceae bacterium]MDE0665818.1 glycine betaine/L-proline ABC transporter ATP-binding protein [Acidimicrobiaceae bacterium]MXW88767.1 glycine betaine/L-proline ABC transporter ATP-binding protein [Acidimicrobiaceae b
MPTKVKIANVVKIFGDEPDGQALELLRAGHSKETIRESTGHIVGVNDANIDVAEGEIFVVMGLSGSGKSTLIRCVNRLYEPTAGSILVDGTDVTALNPKELQAFRRESTGMVFQHFALFPHQDIRSNVSFGLRVKGVDPEARDEAAERALALVGLSGYESSYPRQLSGGMQQRVGLARALATDPDILLMDEAFSALDPLIRRQMQDELMEIQNKLHKTILFITHDLNEALRVGTRVCIMKDGAIHQIGTPEDILMRPETEYVAEFVQDVDQGRVLAVETVREEAAAVPAGATVADVLDIIDNRGSDAAHVVDSGGRPLGVVTRESAERARARRDQQLGPLIEAVPVVTDDTILAKVYQLFGSGLPLAVVDTDGRLIGEVRPLEVLAELGRVEGVSEQLQKAKAQEAQEARE